MTPSGNRWPSPTAPRPAPARAHRTASPLPPGRKMSPSVRPPATRIRLKESSILTSFMPGQVALSRWHSPPRCAAPADPGHCPPPWNSLIGSSAAFVTQTAWASTLRSGRRHLVARESQSPARRRSGRRRPETVTAYRPRAGDLRGLRPRPLLGACSCYFSDAQPNVRRKQLPLGLALS